jgi:ubiquinol-cytochrome c reductase iron-sulfur subunit
LLEKTADMEQWDGDLVVNGKHYTLVIGICTHLGCIPAWKKDAWKCACHGGEFDSSGRQTFGPPPKPFVVPPFKVEGTVLTLGETGPESKAMIDARA